MKANQAQKRGSVAVHESNANPKAGGGGGSTIERLHIKRALKLIRKANTSIHPLDLEKAKIRISESKNKSTDNIPYGEFEPYTLKTYADLKASAKEHFAMEKEKRHLDNTYETVGKPRKIFPDLVEEIFIEQTESARLTGERKKSMSLTNTNLDSRKISTSNAVADFALADKSGVKKRPSTANATRKDKDNNSKNNSHNSDNNNRDDVDYSPDPRNQLRSLDDSNIGFVAPLSLNEKLPKKAFESGMLSANLRKPGASSPDRPRSPVPNSNSPMVSPVGSMRPSCVESDERLKKVRLFKKAIEDNRRQEILDKINEKESRAQVAMELFIISTNTRMLLKVVAAFSRMFLLYSLIYDDRKYKFERKNASRQKKAVWTVENWWWKKRLDLQIQRHPRKQLLLNIVLRMVCSYKVKKRNRSANLIKRFILDQSALSDYMKKVYAFRARAIKVQKYMREWLASRAARLEVLNVALEKLQVKKIEAAKIDAVRRERAALMAAGRMGGFAETLVHINGKIDKLNEIYTVEDEIMKIANRQEYQYQQTLFKIRSEVKVKNSKSEEEKDGKKGKHGKNWKKEKGENIDSGIPQKVLAGAGKGDNKNNLLSSKRSWVQSMNQTKAGRERLQLLDNLLSSLRKEHLLRLKTEKQLKENKPREMVVNMDGLKLFLSNPFCNQAIHQTIDIKDITEQAARKYVPPFFMLTGGGLQRLDAIANQLLEIKPTN